MNRRHVMVLGGGVAGLATALLLARDGHRVTLIERDGVDVGEPEAAPRWERRGIPHFLQPHAVIPRGRMELIEHAPDVYETLIRAGAWDLDLRRKNPGASLPEDQALQYLAVRRPRIEWGLRRAIRMESGITVRAGTVARGIRIDAARVTGVELDGGWEEADVVVDAMGRTSPMRQWIRAKGFTTPAPERSECGVIYYSRYYRLRPGRELPDGPWLLYPRGDLGYMAYSTFPGDNGTLAAVLAVPTGMPELKVFRNELAFEAAVERIPLLRMWINPDLVEPILPVLSMGGLQNTIMAPPSEPAGLFQVGDALAHTDPVLAHGVSFAWIHAVEVARALRAHEGIHDSGFAYTSSVLPAIRERYDLATAIDEQRYRSWTGGAVDVTTRHGDYALFTLAAGGAVALVDADVFRSHLRRFGLLDSTRVLDEDVPLQERMETRFRELRAKPPRAHGPDREEMLAVAEAAMALAPPKRS